MELIPRAQYPRNPEFSPCHAHYRRPWGTIEVSKAVIDTGLLVEQRRVVEPQEHMSAISRRINTPGRRLKNARDALGPLRVSLFALEEGGEFRKWLGDSDQFYRWELPIALTTEVPDSTPEARAAAVMQHIYNQAPTSYAWWNEQRTGTAYISERTHALVNYMASSAVADVALIFQALPSNPYN